MRQAFAVWVTGLPSSGKSTISIALRDQLKARGVDVAVLESDVFRGIFTPRPVYTEEERDVFYQSLAYVGRILVEHGVSVIFDATANRRAYRDRARKWMSHFLEVYVDCPVAVCMSRDPKGIYKKAQEGRVTTLPGLQAAYEKPDHPDVVVLGDREDPASAAQSVVDTLIEKQYL